MTLALLLFCLTIVLIIGSQYQRRAASPPSWLTPALKILAYVMLILAAIYFYNRFTS